MVRTARLGQYAWPQVTPAELTLLVPIGSVEQHGPHLPLDTDTRIAVAVATAARSELTADAPVAVAPEIAYGASGEHEGFAGTISLGQQALTDLLVEFGRSACRWARRIVFVNGHGGNVPTLAAAVARLRYEARDVAWYPCAFADADAHAGHTETSVLLHLSPELVRNDRIEAGNREPIGALMGPMRAGGVAAVSENGILGDPRTASAEHGAQLLTRVVDDLTRALGEWAVDDGGRLR
ncbi:mycofactocin biosynthesis peptidyl-dipeptidase MftE [Gordonia sp. N1V]|uniref:mycofactocin biosynthesis peptidyl-dipeptidase MftE n=1 Tax=Gordonia sp. N1V TaxID=3034163 RepID=UPI0023E1BEAA|nr:mycofactocin biosynthesis peptidyl-dipeptidase MftE [Gordonia sp. N1V]MDF3283411.1 mycofactocin biosynthesis peptidyl-dipeptidase MftE [Gordonia sp. N1V]